MAIILDGKVIAAKMRANIKSAALGLAAKGCTPGLAVILVGDDPASHSYVSAKKKACAENAIRSFEYRYPASVSESELLKQITLCNSDPTVHGILVQLPLPKHIDTQRVIELIAPHKDIDGFGPINIGNMILEKECYIPCTPAGVVAMLNYAKIELSGKHIVVLGRSNIVGRPLSILLSQKKHNATVTLCHSATKNIATYTLQADIVISCIGSPEFLRGDMIKSGATVIDIGVNRIPDPSKKSGYRLVGDAAFTEVEKVASHITPVPGGVGPMTITMLLANTVKAAERSLQ